MGWIFTTWDGQRVFGHDGATLGQGAFQRTLPDAGLSVALLTNGGAHPRDLFESLFGEIFSALAGVDVPQRPEPRADREVTQPERFIGRYVREGVEMTVRPSDGGGLEMAVRSTSALRQDQPPTPPITLLPHDDDVLLAKGPKDEAWTAAVFFDLAGRALRALRRPRHPADLHRGLTRGGSPPDTAAWSALRSFRASGRPSAVTCGGRRR